MHSLSFLVKLLRRRTSDCIAMGAFAGFVVGILLSTTANTYHGPIPASGQSQILLALALGATVITWLVFVVIRGVNTLAIFFIFALALAVASALLALISQFPEWHPLAPLLGAILGALLGALACRLCHRGRRVRHG
jgi:hypothetical protein